MATTEQSDRASCYIADLYLTLPLGQVVNMQHNTCNLCWAVNKAELRLAGTSTTYINIKKEVNKINVILVQHPMRALVSEWRLYSYGADWNPTSAALFFFLGGDLCGSAIWACFLFFLFKKYSVIVISDLCKWMTNSHILVKPECSLKPFLTLLLVLF